MMFNLKSVDAAQYSSNSSSISSYSSIVISHNLKSQIVFFLNGNSLNFYFTVNFFSKNPNASRAACFRWKTVVLSSFFTKTDVTELQFMLKRRKFNHRDLKHLRGCLVSMKGKIKSETWQQREKQQKAFELSAER